MDRLLREANPPTGQLASPKPQYKKPGEDAYEPVEGQYGAPFAILKNASGQVISPATDAKLEQVKSELELIKSELQTIKANQLSGDQKVQLSGNTDSVSVVNIPSQDRVTIEPGQIYHLASVDFEGYRKIMVGVMFNVSNAKFKVHLYSHHLGDSGMFGSGVRATSHDLIRAGGQVMYAYYMEEPAWAMGRLVTVRLENVGDVPAPLRTYEIRRYA